MGIFMGFPFGETKRNQPVKLQPANPLPPNAMSSDSGNAALEGYTALSRANRVTDVRPPVGGTDQYWGPNQAQEQ